MPYEAPVLDRNSTDIATRTVKAFFNVGDWFRIQENASFVRDELDTAFGVTVVFTGAETSPAITNIPDVDDFNRLLENIEQLRQAALSVMPTLTASAVAHDWVAGVTQDAPDYVDVNHWEEVIDIIHNLIATYTALTFRRPRTGIAMSNSGMTWNNRFRS